MQIVHGAFRTADETVPMTMQADPSRPSAGPLFVPRYARVLATDLATSRRPLHELGNDRHQLLVDYGLDDPRTLDAQLTAFSDDDLAEIGTEIARLSRASLDSLAGGPGVADPPTVLWTEPEQIERMIGQTLLWADHYVLEDQVLDAFLRTSNTDRSSIATALRSALALRPLVEAGIVVPVPSGAALAMGAESVTNATTEDLGRPELVRWIENELVLEGPTAREVLIIRARDDERDGIYTYFRPIEMTSESTFTSRALCDYDPRFDYAPWIRTATNQHIARVVQELNADLAVASLFGGEYVTRLPFRARLAAHRAPVGTPALLATLDVPWLPEVDAASMAKLASEDEAVADLRRRVGRLARVSSNEDPNAPYADLVAEIAEEAVGPLERRLRRDNAWRLATPAGLVFGGLVLGATTGPVGLGAAALSGLAWASNAYADYRSNRADAAYLFWSARRMSDDG